MERRWSERVPLSNDVVLYCHGETVPGKIKDMNLEGLFIETNQPPCSDEHMQIEFRCDDTPDGICRVPGNTIHRSNHGVGLQLRFDDQESFRRLRDIWAQRESELHPES